MIYSATVQFILKFRGFCFALLGESPINFLLKRLLSSSQRCNPTALFQNMGLLQKNSKAEKLKESYMGKMGSEELERKTIQEHEEKI